MVLSFTVTDSKGHYINGLKNTDFKIFEDGIPQKISTFAEGNQAADAGAGGRQTRPLVTPAAAEASGGSRASESATRLLRRHQRLRALRYQQLHVSRLCLRRGCHRRFRPRPGPRRFSRGLHLQPQSVARRALTHDRTDAIGGLRKAVAGDDTALYNALLLTLRDAAKVPGRKVVIVFSNGPDNASMVAPDDVRAVAEDEGIPIYVISTNEVNKDPISSSVFRRISTRTGGKAYSAQDLAEAGRSIRIHPRGSGQLLHRDLLSAAQPQRRIPQDHRRDRLRRGQEISRAVTPRLPSARGIQLRRFC